jgi:hypothetical protein
MAMAAARPTSSPTVFFDSSRTPPSVSCIAASNLPFDAGTTRAKILADLIPVAYLLNGRTKKELFPAEIVEQLQAKANNGKNS